MKTLTTVTAWVWIALVTVLTLAYLRQYSFWPMVGVIPWGLLLCRHTRIAGWWTLVVLCWLFSIPLMFGALSPMVWRRDFSPQHWIMLAIALPPFVTWLILKDDHPLKSNGV